MNWRQQMTDEDEDGMEAYVPVRAVQTVALKLFEKKLEATIPQLKEIEADIGEEAMEKVSVLIADLMTMGITLSLHMDPDGSRFHGVSMTDVINQLADELSLEEERTIN
jgi:hypothetical protein